MTVAGDLKVEGKRNYSKLDYCSICKDKSESKISSPLFAVHAVHPKVKGILELPSGSKERKRLLMLLQNEGNHQHDTEVIKLCFSFTSILFVKVQFRFL